MEIIEILPQVSQYGLAGLALVLGFLLLRRAIDKLASLGQKLVNAFNALDNSIVKMTQTLEVQSQGFMAFQRSVLDANIELKTAVDGVHKLMEKQEEQSTRKRNEITDSLSNIQTMVQQLKEKIEPLQSLVELHEEKANVRNGEILQKLRAIADQLTTLAASFESSVKEEEKEMKDV